MRKPSSSSRICISASAIWLTLVSCTSCLVVALVLSPNLGGTTNNGPRQSNPGSPSHPRQLPMADRIAYQRAIDKVYWNHQLWPDTNSKPKPSFDQVVSTAQLEKKVGDYLRDSKALEDYWQRPIEAKQLQAEMDRMVRQSNKPELLRELFGALENDPFVIAECLARPILAERLATSFYAYDERFHGELRRRAEAELEAHSTVTQGRQTSGIYREIDWVKSSEGDRRSNGRKNEAGVTIESSEWVDKVAMLEATVDGEAGKFGELQEDESRYYATAMVDKTKDRIRFARIEWQKESFDSWRDRAESQTPKADPAPGESYVLPAASDAVNEANTDSWTPTSSAPSDRSGHTAVWTGTEMIVWGGTDDRTGGRYDPATNIWRATSTVNAPNVGFEYTVVWSGSEMIVWGGGGTNGGGRYDPGTDSWTPTTTVNAPTGRRGHAAVWTGSEMIVWGGYDGSYSNTGGRYNPDADSWVATNTNDAPTARSDQTAVWTGSEMIVWGGYNYDDSSPYPDIGGRYNPVTDSWIATNSVNAPTGRVRHTAVWTGAEMIIWSGFPSDPDQAGARYNPVADSWVATSTVGAPVGRFRDAAVWSGSEMIVWGGVIGYDFPRTGARYNPGTDTWTPTSDTSAPVGRWFFTAVWADTEMIVWGGYRQRSDFNSSAVAAHTLGRYRPSDDTWTVVSSTASAGSKQAVVSTGNEMIVWGGLDAFGTDIGTGARYNLATDSWAATPETGAPGYRAGHTAVWTGSEMIVWGGYFTDGGRYETSTGARYNPITNSWIATLESTAPTRRYDHAAVWTGSEMIVWGGYWNPFPSEYVATGGKYDPDTDSWSATSLTNAPDGRSNHSAVWTGNDMIVWGGSAQGLFMNTGGRYDPLTDNWTALGGSAPTSNFGSSVVWAGNEMIVWGGDSNSGARYNPVTDSWIPTATANAPSARSDHTATWTGNEMIVWGGVLHDGSGDQYLNTGARYDPLTDNWTPTTVGNAPSARARHLSVWTGNEMIVWGGYFNDGRNRYLNTGGRYAVAESSPTPSPTPIAAPTPTPTPDPGSTPPATVSISGTVDYCSDTALGPLPNVMLNLAGGPASTTLSDGSGSYAFAGLAAGGTYTVTPSKDAMPPASSVINTLDAMAVQRHYLGEVALTGCPLSAANSDGNMVIDTVDVLAIQRFFIGRTFGTGNVGHYQFNPASRTYPAISGNQTGQDYDALVIGDVISPAARP